ncbi:MAG: bifunctional methylenetetrahydrofolate dehydrogenase/methenyltetrahydrofolate cyclohydrolase FolD [Lachnospirales bacterium]
MENIIDGKAISAIIKDEVKKDADLLISKGLNPCLAVILVGENPASQVYVRNKKRACEYCNIKSLSYELSADITEDELLALIDKLNEDKQCNGILVQLPLPKHIDENKVLLRISPEKDVDGFHPYNVGLLSIGTAALKACTPAGCIELIKRSGVDITGKNCVVVGRSNIVGKPVGMLLTAENGTVTTCHSKTKNMAEICKNADILVAAIGKAKFITADMVKEGAVVIDVGINRMDNGKLCGDVDFDEVEKKAGFITPVPGGVGPMTIAMLMKNCITACKMQNNVTED